jgi:small conductance mechanosensitive channel
MTFGDFQKTFGSSLIGSAGRAVLVLILIWVAILLINRFTGRFSKLLMWRHAGNAEIKKRAATLTSFLRYLLILIVVGIGGMMLLKNIGVDIGPILASAGVVGLAVGFGAQNLVQDIISGFFILLDDEIRVGDVVNIKGKGGLVERVGLRVVVLRDLDGSVHYIRNGQIDIVSNMTKDFGNYLIELRIPYGQNPDKVVEIFKSVDEEMRKDAHFGPDILKPLDIYGVEQLAESWMFMRARTTTKPLRQWDVGREYLRRVRVRLEAEKIPLAAPAMAVKLTGSEPETPPQESQP